MGKPNQGKPVTSQEIKPVLNSPLADGEKVIDAKEQQNILANFINSENTDITVEKNEAELNDKIDDSEKNESPVKSGKKKLEDIPKKYWKHQTV